MAKVELAFVAEYFGGELYGTLVVSDNGFRIDIETVTCDHLDSDRIVRSNESPEWFEYANDIVYARCTESRNMDRIAEAIDTKSDNVKLILTDKTICEVVRK